MSRMTLEIDVARQELLAREPLFHRREFIFSAESFDACTAADFWEVGASGACYTRDDVRSTILDRLATQPQDLMDTQGWQVTDFDVRRLSDDIYLATYQLDQVGRLSRRSTLWRREQGDWVLLYHQGTLIEAG